MRNEIMTVYFYDVPTAYTYTLSPNLSTSVLVDDYHSFVNDQYRFNVEQIFSNFPNVGMIIAENGNSQSYLYDPNEVCDFCTENCAIYDTTTIFPTAPISTPSLNGNGCEFTDNTVVTVSGRTNQYTVKSSSFFLLDDNTYTVLYNLQSPTGETLNAPETLCERYVTPVTTP